MADAENGQANVPVPTDPAKAGPSAPLTHEQSNSCALVMNIVALISSWQWMSYQPTYPLLLTLRLELPVSSVSYAYAVFIGSALITTLLMSTLTRRYTTRELLYGLMIFRGLAGVLHAFGVWFVNDSSLWLLFVSRALHGVTMIQVPLSMSWVGARLPVEAKGDAVTSRNLYGGIGMVLGPMSGSLFAAVFDEVTGYVAPGIFNIISAIAMFVLIRQLFVDGDKLPTKESAGKAILTKEQKAAELGCGTLTAAGLHLALVAIGHAGIDSILSLDLLEFYGWRASQMMIVWAPVVAFYSIGTLTAGKLVHHIGLLGTLAVQYACLAGGLLAFPWFDMTQTISVIQLVMALSSWMCGASIAVTLHTTILTQRLAPWQNVDIQPRIHIGLTLGRCSGPLMSAMFFELGSTASKVVGANLNIAAAVCVSLLACVPTSGFCGDLYIRDRERQQLDSLLGKGKGVAMT